MEAVIKAWILFAILAAILLVLQCNNRPTAPAPATKIDTCAAPCRPDPKPGTP